MSETVVKRQDYEHLVLRSHTDHRMGLLHICSIVSVCQKNTLRICRRSRSIADVGIVIRSYRAVSLDELIFICSKELISHLQDIPDIHLVFLKIRNLVKDDDFLHHRTLRKYLSYLRELEL